jgi:RNA polymerase sigma-70 factor, ECF subfamily
MASCPTLRRDDTSVVPVAASVVAERRLPSAVMVSSEPNEAELLARYVGGEEVAFERLYDAHQRPCLDFIRRMLAGAGEATAEDLHQDVWIAVALHAASFDSAKSRFVTWLFTIARNKVMDHFRRTSGIVVVAAETDESTVDTIAELPAAPEVSPERVAQNRQLAAAIISEVQALPYVQRETFVLFAHQELSLEEVAQVTCVGVETAKSRLRYARATLRSRLAPWKLQHA